MCRHLMSFLLFFICHREVGEAKQEPPVILHVLQAVLIFQVVLAKKTQCNLVWNGRGLNLESTLPFTGIENCFFYIALHAILVGVNISINYWIIAINSLIAKLPAAFL